MDATGSPAHSSDYKFWLTFEQAAVGIALVRPDGRFMRANPELCLFLGYSESELKELRFQNITHRDDVDAEQALIYRVISGEMPTFRAEKRLIRRDGRTVWAMQSVSVVRDRAGNPLHLITVIQDVTHRKQPTATTAPDNADLLPQLLSEMPLGMLVVDATGQPRFANQAAREILGSGVAPGGVNETEVYNAYREGTGELYPPEEAPLSRALIGENVVVEDIEIHRPEGVLPVRVWAAPVYNRAGNMEYALAAIAERLGQARIVEVGVGVEVAAPPASGDVEELFHLAAEIASDVGRAHDLHEAIQVCLDRVCGMTGLPVGHLLLARRQTGQDGATTQLYTSGVWHIDEPERVTAFRKATEAILFSEGEGLPGKALATGEAVWSTDLGAELAASRSKEATAEGLRTGMAFPVYGDGAILAVMEFFSGEDVEPDSGLLDVMQKIGAHLGNAIMRRIVGDELERAQARYRAIADISSDLVSAHDPEGKYLFAGRASAALLGYEPAELAGSSVLTYCHPDDLTRLGRMFSRYLAGSDEPAQVKYRTQRKDGEYVWLELSAQPLAGTYGRGREIICVTHALHADLQAVEAEAERANQAVRDEPAPYTPLETPAEPPADRDPLTSLHNREAIDELLTAKLTSRRASTFPVGCLFIDVDNFDSLTATYGPEKAGEALKQVATLLEETCRDDDFLGRYSGSAFIIALPNTDAAGTIVVGEKVLKKTRATDWAHMGLAEKVHVSIGGTCLRHGTTLTLPDLMEILGSQLLQAKGSGGDCIIMNAREAARQNTGVDPFGGWTQTLRIALNSQLPGAPPEAREGN